MRWSSFLYFFIGAVVFIWLLKVPFLSFYLTQKLRVPISLDWISIWPRETVMTRFQIDNPAGFPSGAALEADRVKISYNWRQLLSKESIIDRIAVDTIHLYIDFTNGDQSRNNWTALSDEMPKRQPGKNYLIRDLIFRNFTIEIRGLGIADIIRHVDFLEFSNVSSEDGFPTEELIHKMFGNLDLGKFIEDSFNPVHLIEDAADPLNLFGQ